MPAGVVPTLVGNPAQSSCPVVRTPQAPRSALTSLKTPVNAGTESPQQVSVPSGWMPQVKLLPALRKLNVPAGAIVTGHGPPPSIPSIASSIPASREVEGGTRSVPASVPLTGSELGSVLTHPAIAIEAASRSHPRRRFITVGS